MVGAVFDETEGNPFFVEEVFRHLVEEGNDLRRRRRVPHRHHGSTSSTFPRASGSWSAGGSNGSVPKRRRSLAAGAVVGRAFPFALLEAVSDTDDERVARHRRRSRGGAGHRSEERDGEVVYSFAHELIRQTLLSGLSLLRRQRLHLAVADAIEALDAGAATSRGKRSPTTC